MKGPKETEEGPNSQSGRGSEFAAGRRIGTPKAGKDSSTKSSGLKGQLPSIYFFLIFFFLTVGIIAAGFLYYRQHAQSYKAEVERGLSAVAKLKVDELVDWRAERLADASFLYKNASFSGLVRRFFERPNDSAVRDQVGTWLSHIQAAYEYDRIFLLDAQCSVRLSAPDTPEPVAAHLLKQAPEILRSGRITFLDFHRDTPDRPIHLSILVPILDGGEDNRAIGILVLRIDPRKYLYPYIQRWPTPSRTAETLIIRRDGNDALFLNELQFQKNTALNLRIPLTNKKAPAVQAILGRRGIMDGVDYNGVPVVAALRAVPDSPWFLVARMDISEVHAPLKEWLWVVIVLVGSMLLGAGAGTGSIWRHQRAQFYRARFEAAEAMRAVSSRYEALLSAVPDIIMEVDINMVYVLANQAGLNFFGEDVIGKEAAFYYEGEQDTSHTVRPLFDGHESVIYVESWQRRKDGEKRLLAWWCRALKDENGRVTGALSSARDITERKRVEVRERLVRDVLYFLNHFESTTDTIHDILGIIKRSMNFEAVGIRLREGDDFPYYQTNGFPEDFVQTERYLCARDEAGTIVRDTEGNAVLECMCGNILCGRTDPKSPFFTERGSFWSNSTTDLLASTTEMDRQARVCKRCNSEGYESVALIPLRAGEEIIGLLQFNDHRRNQFTPEMIHFFEGLGASIGIALSRKQAEVELRKKNDELERFTYSISHDLKSPLVTIQTFLGYLEQDARKPDPEGVDKDLRYIRTAADKMSTLLNEVLELSRIGRKESQPVEVRLQEIVNEALDLVAGRIAERGAKVSVTEEPILLFGDSSRLVEVFQNLVDNAVKSMGDEPAPQVEIGVEKTGEEIVLFVRDNGIGIDPQQQPRLFGMFEKLNPGTEGTGIGLALVRRIVEAHGGRIWVESEGRGKGTTFRFTLEKTRRGLR